MRRLLGFLLPMLLALPLLAACGKQAPPVDVGALTAALSSGRFKAVAFDGATPAAVRKDYHRIVTGLGTVKPTVTAGKATVDKSAATVPLHWSWPFSGGTWSYDSKVALTLVKDQWLVDWSPKVVQSGLEDDTAALVLGSDHGKQGHLRSAKGVDLDPVSGQQTLARPLMLALAKRYDTQLNGAPGIAVSIDDGDAPSHSVFSTKPTDGHDVTVSISPKLQRLAERLLAGVGPASALVAIQPSTGKVLVAANGPGNNGLNIATYGQAPSGSTFKTIDSLALLRNGLTPETRVPCTTHINVDGEIFSNDSEYPATGKGHIPWKLAVANSCNTAVISQRHKISGADLQSAAASLGFGIDYDTGYPAYFGQIPLPASETEKAADMIGQGKVLASPLVLASVIATIQHGSLITPTLVAGVTPTKAADAPDLDVKPLTAGEDKQLKTILREVVLVGTGEGLRDIPGPPVIAKTGTAEFDRNGQRLTHAWMIAAQGDLAVAVFVDVGHTGAGTAGPVLEAFLRGAR